MRRPTNCDPQRAYQTMRLTREIMLGMHGERSLPLMPGENYVKGCPEVAAQIYAQLDRELGPLPSQANPEEPPRSTPPFRKGDYVWLQDEGGWVHAPANIPGAAGDIALWSGQYDGRRGVHEPEKWEGFQRKIYEQGYAETALKGRRMNPRAPSRVKIPKQLPPDKVKPTKRPHPGSIVPPPPGPTPEDPTLKPLFPTPPGPGGEPKQWDPSGIPDIPEAETPWASSVCVVEEFSPTPYNFVTVDIQVPGNPNSVGWIKNQKKLSQTVKTTFQWIYRAWDLARTISEASWPDFENWWYPQEFGWGYGGFGLAPGVGITGAGYFGTYNPGLLQNVVSAYTQIGEMFTSQSDPMRLGLSKGTKCSQEHAQALFYKAANDWILLCPVDVGFDAAMLAEKLLAALLPNTINGVFASQLIGFAKWRENNYGSCKFPWFQLPCQPTPFNVNWETWNTGKAQCTDGEKNKLEEAYPMAIWIVDAGKRYLDALAKLSSSERERMWKWQGLTMGSQEWWEASQLVALEDWFGPYQESKFNRVRNVVTWLMNRFRYGTKKHDPLVYKCKAHKVCFEHFKGAGAWHDSASVGRITLCQPFFKASPYHPFGRADTLIHENLHMLRDDNAWEDDPRDVTHAQCSGEAGYNNTNVCYGQEGAKHLVWASQSLALENVDNFTSWLTAFYYRNRGCWPRQYINRGYGAGQPDLWAPPPGEFKTNPEIRPPRLRRFR